MKKVLFVCLGNICRSPMAEMIFKHLVNIRCLENEFFIDSAGTSSEEFGNPIYPNIKAVLRKNNISFTEHKAQVITKEDYNKFDYIICMEQSNVRSVLRIIGEDPEDKVYRIMDFTDNPCDIGDPWYHRDFDRTYKEIILGCEALLNKLTN